MTSDWIFQNSNNKKCFYLLNQIYHFERFKRVKLQFWRKQYTLATKATLNSMAKTGITPIDDSYAKLSSNYSQSRDLQSFRHPATSYTLLHQNTTNCRLVNNRVQG